MVKIRFFRLLLGISILWLTGCATQSLNQSKQDFDSQNYAAALAKMQPLANKGNAAAEYAVGYMLYYGKGTPVDQQQGIAWINKAADQGLAEAQQAKILLDKAVAANPLDTH